MNDENKSPDLGSVGAVPAWLECPSTTQIVGPVQTRPQELPLDNLNWEDFERLCLRLVRINSEIQECRIYGVRGQAQEGIDLYSRQHGQPMYSVYQCKRVENLGPADIREAVDRFLAGKWAGRASKFVLCTTYKAHRTELADECLAQVNRLTICGKTFIIWDTIEISNLLKNHPELVDDFFGRSWISAFCGNEAAALLKNRLDASRVIEFRKALGEFYARVFNQHDPGVPVPPQPGIGGVSLASRYVLPEIITEESIGMGRAGAATAEQSGPAPEQYGQPSFESPSEPIAAFGGLGSGSIGMVGRSYRRRESVDAWLSRSNRSIVVGAPGSGKSSLLRYIALDLFSDSPSMVGIASRWARLLPVWLPFAFWTRLIASEPSHNCSLSECLKRWFAQWDEIRLWPLVEAAIEDERLLLLVDGLDEWASDESGRTAGQMLQVFVEPRKAGAVVSTRPHGLQTVRICGADWQVGELASLSPHQRKELCCKWFSIKIGLDAGPGQIAATLQIDRALYETERFLEELSQSSDLSELSASPLLLLLLIYVRFQHMVLPRHRFQAYDVLVDHLVRVHPAVKLAASFANQGANGLSPGEVRDVLANLAFKVHTRYPEGVFPESEAAAIVEAFLSNSNGPGLGMPLVDARRYVPQFVKTAEERLGLLVRQGVRELGFFHRSLQEFLAATHLSRMSIAEQETIVESRQAEPQWRQVILALFWLTSRTEDLARLLARVQEAKALNVRDLATFELLAEVAFGDFRCPADWRQRTASEALHRINTHPWMIHRQRLLNHALEGLRSITTREIVRKRLRSWVWSRTGWRAGWYLAMEEWPPTEETIEALLTAFHDEEGEVKRAAGQILATVAVGDEAIGNTIFGMALRALDPQQRAAALGALGKGWPSHPQLGVAVDAARRATAPELRFAGIAVDVGRQMTRDGDLEELLGMASHDGFAGYSRGSAELVSTLVSGWKGDIRLRSECLKAARQRYGPGDQLDTKIATAALLRAFPQDPEVASYCADEIRSQEYPFLGLHFEAWRWVSDNFRDHPQVVEAIELWASQQKYHEPEVALAALAGRTPRMKRQLIVALQGSFPFWSAESLLLGWGMSDPEVAAALSTMSRGPAESASMVGRLIPEIVPDRDEARTILLTLISDPDCKRHDFVVSGLAQLSPHGEDPESSELCLRSLPVVRESYRPMVVGNIILGFPRDPRVRDLAKRALNEREAPVAAIAQAFASDAEMRSEVAQVLNPLPVTLRGQIAEAMSRSGDDDGFTKSVLATYDLEEDSQVKVVASLAHHRQLRQEGADATDAIRQLSGSIRAYGFDHEERRQAAFVGLLLLKRLDVMAQARETIGDSAPVSIRLDRPFEPNIPLLQLVAEHWSDLTNSFGADLPQRLSQHGSGFWENVCLVAPDFPSTHQDILRAIDARPEILNEPSAITLLSKMFPRSSRLLDLCLRAIERNDDTWGGSERLRSVLMVAADAFGGDSEAFQQFVARIPPSLEDDRFVLTVCSVWPDNPVLDDLYDQLRSKDRPGVSYPIFFAIAYAKMPAVDIPSRLQKDLENNLIFRGYLFRSLADSVLRRVRRDADVRMRLVDSLKSNLSVAGKINVPRLLAAARSVSPEVVQWCEEELGRQLDGSNPPQLGFDILAGSVRSVALCLVDVLDTNR